MSVENVPEVPQIEFGEEVADIRKTAIDPNFWYPIARSKDVKRGKTRAVSFSGESIVLVRPTKGKLFALENRCAHRQVPLDIGKVSGCTIKCGYHGWEYDANGDCISIPYLDSRKTKRNNVKHYPSKEAYGLIFIFPGDIDKATDETFPNVPSATNPKYKTRYLDRTVDCHYTFMHENLMDMNHQFLHRKLMGGIKTMFLGMRHGSNWFESDYTFTRATGSQPLGEKFMLGDRPKAAPGERDLMTIRTEYPYQTLKFWTAGSEEPALDLWNIYVPIDKENRKNHTFGLMMIRRPKISLLLDIFWPFIVWFTNGIFKEDRIICELEQNAFDNQGSDLNNEVFPAIKGLRKVLIENGVAPNTPNTN